MRARLDGVVTCRGDVVKDIAMLFNDVLVFIDYECDGEDCYAMTVMLKGHDWYNYLTETAISELNEALNKVLAEKAAEAELEEKLSNLENNQ